MCVGVPMRVVSIDGTEAVADIDGVRRQVSLMLLDDKVELGDFVIVHAGFAISRLDEEEARQTLELMRQVLNPGDLA